ncbi:MAG: ElyC/SanA/YdcF family protein [Acidimicrobiales bacterium]
MIGDLAVDEGWESIVMVTSSYHVSRAELLLKRCFDGTITAVGAETDLSASSWVNRVAHEWLGHLHARILARSC